MMNAKEEKKARAAANEKLALISREYHNYLALCRIDAILSEAGFREMEPGIYCGREGHVHEQVGERTWLSLTWHEMELTGRYEITVYLS